VASYDGTDLSPHWNFIDSLPSDAVNGANMNNGEHAFAPSAAVADNEVFVAWHESHASSGATQLHLARNNGPILVGLEVLASVSNLIDNTPPSVGFTKVPLEKFVVYAAISLTHSRLDSGEC
jgi:hypothetical protein